jgi:(p)ppGpp synthase/HD superfamily hydrolase
MLEQGDGIRVFGPTWDAELSAGTGAVVERALEFARGAHGEQCRPAGEPYIEHLREAVAVLVDGLGVTDPDLLVAAALHDVVEDTDVVLGEVEEEFGSSVSEMVAWVTKRPDEEKPDYLARLASAPDPVIWLKLADRLSNVQRLDTHPRPEKRARYYDETVTWILPLASRHPWFAAWFSEWQRQFSWLSE